MLRRLVTAAASGAALTALVALPSTAAAEPAAAPRTTSAAPAQDAPTGLSVNGIARPVDVEGTPLLGWHVRVARQSAYQIVVSTSRAAASAGEGDVWDSGKVAGGEQRGVAYDGAALEPAQRYFWAVRTWDASDEATGWSEVAEFGTGTAWQSSQPVWTPTGAGNWTDYTLETDFTVVQNAASVTFRTTSGSAFHLWQIRSDTNTLKTHTGTTLVDETPLADKGITITNGTRYRLRIEVDGTTFRTWIDDVLVHTAEGRTAHPAGGFGFRTGSTEQARFDNVSVTAPDGTVLYSNDFANGAPELPTLTTANGELVVGTSKNDFVPGSWSNYTLSAKVTVNQVATGLTFRAADTNNSYMWQIRGDNNRLVTHTQIGGTYAALKTVTLPAGTVAVGKTVTVRIEAVGTTIRTWIDDVLVDTTVDATFRRGYVGVRNGRTESATFDDVSVVDRNTGATLLSDDFSNGNKAFACGTPTNGALVVGLSQVCLSRGLSNNWVFLRDEVEVDDKEIAWAALYATGANPKTAEQYVHKTWINGEFAGLGPTQSINGETRYDGYDVTDLVQPGRPNVIGALAYTTSVQKYQAELVVAYADGTRDVFGTGDSWTALNGDSVFPQAGSITSNATYYTAPRENLQSTEFPWGWDEAGFDDTAWSPAATRSALPALTATPTDKVREELKAPVEIVDRGNGTYVVDFGRTWIGGVRYTVEGTAGATLDLRFGEVKNADGTVKYQLNTSNVYQDVVTLRGGSQTIETWGARVFRYLEIRGATQAPTAETLQALALVYPFDAEASEFAASDDDLVDVYELSKNSIESLNLNFYTDSWTRERRNYEADGYLQQMSTLYLMDDLSLARYSMDYFKNNRTWPTEWPIYIVLAVRDAWRQTGDVTQVAAYYDNLQTKAPTKWIDPATGLIRKTAGSNACGSTDCDIVDWPASERDGYQFRQYNTVLNALSYRAFRDMAEMATVLGKEADAAEYTAIADRLRAAMNELLYDPATGEYDDGLDADLVKTGHSALHANAFALAFGVPTDAERDKVADEVASRGMACSVYCAAFLVKGLYDGDRGQAALDMQTTGTGVRSWLNMIRLGAGATMEAWDPSLKPNLTFSHPWAASPAFNIPSGLFGIQPESPGYATFRIKPQPGDLDWASIKTPTVRGSVGAAFDHGDGGDLRVVASVPGNTRATVSLPTEETEPTTVYVDGVARTVTPADGYLTVRRVTPGCHLVTTEVDAEVTGRVTDVCTEPLAEGVSVTASVTPEGGDGWAGAGAELTLDLAAAPEGATLEYRIGDGAWTAYDGPVALDEGSYAVEHRVLDDGDVVATGTVPVKVDGVAPETTVAVAEEPAGTATLTFTATDDASGVASTEYRVDEGEWTTLGEDPVTVEGYDEHVVEYRSTDVAGNIEETQQEVVDLTAAAPTGELTTTVESPHDALTVPVTLTFDQDVTGLEVADLVVTGGTASALEGEGDTWTFTLTAAGEGEVSVSLPADAVENGDGVGNVAVAALVVEIDLSAPAPTGVLTTTVESPHDELAFPVTLTFDQDVVGLELADLVVTGGTASALEGEGDTWTFTVTASADGEVTVSVPADVVENGDGVGNAAVAPISVVVDTPEDPVDPLVAVLDPQRISNVRAVLDVLLSGDGAASAPIAVTSSDERVVAPDAVSVRGTGATRTVVVEPAQRKRAGAAVVTVTVGDGEDVATVRFTVLVGGDRADRLTGTAEVDVMFGGRGADVLVGRAGDDLLSGGTGADVLNGGAGDDVLYGGPGSDRQVGGPGSDTFSGDEASERWADHDDEVDVVLP